MPDSVRNLDTSNKEITQNTMPHGSFASVTLHILSEIRIIWRTWFTLWECGIKKKSKSDMQFDLNFGSSDLTLKRKTKHIYSNVKTTILFFFFRINNHFKYKWVKCTNWKTEIGRTDKKTWPRNTLLIYKRLIFDQRHTHKWLGLFSPSFSRYNTGNKYLLEWKKNEGYYQYFKICQSDL